MCPHHDEAVLSRPAFIQLFDWKEALIKWLPYIARDS